LYLMVIDKAGGAVIDYDSGLGEVLTELPGQPAGNSMAYTGPVGPSCIEKFDSYAEFFASFGCFGSRGAGLQGPHRVTSSVIAGSS
jgi:hypothetical protein